MRLVLASSNAHKAAEIRALLPIGFQLTPQDELGVESPDETGTTFIENALLKARHASRITGLPSIADDSGLCIPALGGAPGIFSARYAGKNSTDRLNLEKLLDKMHSKTEREAFFYCVLVYLNSHDDPTPLIAEARWQGDITLAPCGEGGFGYDPVFRIPSLNKTAAELDPSEKNRLSHRGQALLVLSRKLSEHHAS